MMPASIVGNAGSGFTILPLAQTQTKANHLEYQATACSSQSFEASFRLGSQTLQDRNGRETNFNMPLFLKYTNFKMGHQMDITYITV